MPTSQQPYAELYDVAVSDWPGEIDFHRYRIGSRPVCGESPSPGAAHRVALGIVLPVFLDGIDKAQAENLDALRTLTSSGKSARSAVSDCMIKACWT